MRYRQEHIHPKDYTGQDDEKIKARRGYAKGALPTSNDVENMLEISLHYVVGWPSLNSRDEVHHSELLRRDKSASER